MPYAKTKTHNGKDGWITGVIIAAVFLLSVCVPAEAVYVKTTTFKGEDGWIVATASGKRTFDDAVEVDLPDSFTLRHPARHDTAWRIVEGGVVSDTTGAEIVPTPAQAKDRLLRKAKGEWGFNRGQVRKLLKKYAIYEFLDGSNFEEAKAEVEFAVGAGDISDTQGQWVKDMLEGRAK